MLSLVLICSRRHGLGQHCSMCEHLSVTDNLSQAMIASLPAKLNSAQLRRQAGGQCLGQITTFCENWETERTIK